MARKKLDMRIVHGIILESIVGKNMKEIRKIYPDVSYSTIYRLTHIDKFTAKKYGIFRKFISEHPKFIDFQKEFWSYFSEPQMWPDNIILDIYKKIQKYDLKFVYANFEIKVSYDTFKKLYKNGELKKAFDIAWSKNHDQSKLYSPNIYKEVKENKEEDVKELIERLKSLTGASEVILKF